MWNSIPLRSVALAALAAAVLTPLTARAETIYGLTNLQELVTFDSNAPSAVTSTVGLTGFSIGGEFLRSIDVRPATGELYGVSSASNLYKINPLTGVSTQIGASFAIPLSGNTVGIDFNPVVDRLRVVTSSGQNLRVNPNTGAVVDADLATAGVQGDGTLAFAAADSNSAITPAVVAAAYTNSRPNALTTTLFNIDAATNSLVTQSPPNAGTLNTVGSLGFDVVDSGGFTGFDIASSDGTAYLVGNSFFGSGLTANSLYSVDLATGAATLEGAISGVNGSFRDIAVAAVVPEPGTLALLGVSGIALLLRRRARII